MPYLWIPSEQNCGETSENETVHFINLMEGIVDPTFKPHKCHQKIFSCFHETVTHAYSLLEAMSTITQHFIEWKQQSKKTKVGNVITQMRLILRKWWPISGRWSWLTKISQRPVSGRRVCRRRGRRWRWPGAQGRRWWGSVRLTNLDASKKW